MRACRGLSFCAGITGAFCVLHSIASAGMVNSYGPTHYESVADTPAGFCTGPGTVEDFEMGVNPFLTISPGLRIGPGYTSGSPDVKVDSVDLDGMGIDDGFGFDGWSWFSGNNNPSISVMFQDPVKAAGLVFTDGDKQSTQVTLKAYDATDMLIGTINGGDLADDSYGGQTAEDSFLGFNASMGGIKRLEITIDKGSGIEIDHVQWQPIPEPSSAVLLLGAVMAVLGFRRR
jgi:hypothetical protein